MIKIRDLIEIATLYLMGNEDFDVKKEGHLWYFYFEDTDKIKIDRKLFKEKKIPNPPQPKDIQMTMQWLKEFFEE